MRDYVSAHRKAIAGLLSQAVTTAIAWVGLHTGLDVAPDTAALISGTAGSAITAWVIKRIPNDPAATKRVYSGKKAGVHKV